jgi:hypothetical protein
LRDDRAAALAVLRDAGLMPGRTLVLFPYVQSFLIDWSAALARLASDARDEGWQVVTSCTDTEVPIPGTEAVSLPFPLLRPFCEAAGYAVSVRSGISDMLPNTTCRHVALYGRTSLLAAWGLQVMGLGGTTSELMMVPQDSAAPAIASRIMTLLSAPDDSGQSVSCPPEVLGAFSFLSTQARGSYAVGAVVRLGLATPHVRLRAGLAYADVVLTDGWMHEDWGAWSYGARASLWLRVPAQASRITFLGHAAVNEGFPHMHLTVVIGRMRHAVTLRWPLHEPLITLPLPAGLNPDLPLLVEFEIKTPQSPLLLSDGANPDRRPLGLALRGLSFA